MIGALWAASRRPGLVFVGLILAAPVVAGGVADQALPHLGICGPVPGAYQLPGADGCLRVSGLVAGEIGLRSAAVSLPGLQGTSASTGFGPPGARSLEIGRSAIGADARFSVDVRIPTAYGPARVFVSLRARHGPASAR